MLFRYVVSVYSGKPVNIKTGGEDNHDGILNARPARVARNTMPGPGLVDLDLNLSHDFPAPKSKEGNQGDFSFVEFVQCPQSPQLCDLHWRAIISLFRTTGCRPAPGRMQLDVQFKF
jgi:hypothetical protein